MMNQMQGERWEPKTRKGAARPVLDLEEKASVELVVGGGCDRQRSFRNHEVRTIP